MKEDINLNKFIENLKNESDRGVVLVSAELINNYLTSLFEKYLVLNKDLKKDILENPLAPLNTFSLTFFCSFSHKINF